MNTKVFGEIEIDDDKIITFESGIIGFPELNHFAMVHNSEKPDAKTSWLVSVEEPAFALPVIDPLIVKGDYNPDIEDELLIPLGDEKEAEYVVLTTISVPKGNPEGTTTNLKAPIIINTTTKKGTQVILDDDSLQIKYPIFDILSILKAKGDK